MKTLHACSFVISVFLFPAPLFSAAETLASKQPASAVQRNLDVAAQVFAFMHTCENYLSPSIAKDVALTARPLISLLEASDTSLDVKNSVVSQLCPQRNSIYVVITTLVNGKPEGFHDALTSVARLCHFVSWHIDDAALESSSFYLDLDSLSQDLFAYVRTSKEEAEDIARLLINIAYAGGPHALRAVQTVAQEWLPLFTDRRETEYVNKLSACTMQEKSFVRCSGALGYASRKREREARCGFSIIDYTKRRPLGDGLPGYVDYERGRVPSRLPKRRRPSPSPTAAAGAGRGAGAGSGAASEGVGSGMGLRFEYESHVDDLLHFLSSHVKGNDYVPARTGASLQRRLKRLRSLLPEKVPLDEVRSVLEGSSDLSESKQINLLCALRIDCTDALCDSGLEAKKKHALQIIHSCRDALFRVALSGSGYLRVCSLLLLAAYSNAIEIYNRKESPLILFEESDVREKVRRDIHDKCIMLAECIVKTITPDNAVLFGASWFFMSEFMLYADSTEDSDSELDKEALFNMTPIAHVSRIIKDKECSFLARLGMASYFSSLCFWADNTLEMRELLGDMLDERWVVEESSLETLRLMGIVLGSALQFLSISSLNYTDVIEDCRSIKKLFTWWISQEKFYRGFFQKSLLGIIGCLMGEIVTNDSLNETLPSLVESIFIDAIKVVREGRKSSAAKNIVYGLRDEVAGSGRMRLDTNMQAVRKRILGATEFDIFSKFSVIILDTKRSKK